MTWRRSIYAYIGQKLWLALKDKYQFLGLAGDTDGYNSYKYLIGPTGGFAKYMGINYTTRDTYYSPLQE